MGLIKKLSNWIQKIDVEEKDQKSLGDELYVTLLEIAKSSNVSIKNNSDADGGYNIIIQAHSSGDKIFDTFVLRAYLHFGDKKGDLRVFYNHNDLVFNKNSFKKFKKITCGFLKDYLNKYN